MERNATRTRVLGVAVALAAGVGMSGALAQCGPRRANPCAPRAANPCAPCAPRAANPCAAKNPCAANPCAAKNPCAANPCAANPCAANPCAANPCAANPCGANPCGPAKGAKLTTEQASQIYQQIKSALADGYAKSNLPEAKAYQNWSKYNTAPYQSETHGSRYVNNYANDVAKDYGRYEPDRVLPVGSILAKDSMMGAAGGKATPGPLFLMEKMPAGFNAESADWKYTLIGPNGQVVGVTNGKGSDNVTFCAACHQAAGKSQAFFLPEEFRVTR